MAGSEIYLKFKTWVEDRATVALNGLLNTTKRLGSVGQQVIGSLSGAFGGLEGAVGKTVGAIGNIAVAVASLGMIGGTFVAAQVAISIWADDRFHPRTPNQFALLQSDRREKCRKFRNWRY